jgi:hypothetical protein
MDFLTTWATWVLVATALVMVGALALFAFVSFVTIVGLVTGALTLPSDKVA